MNVSTYGMAYGQMEKINGPQIITVMVILNISTGIM
jgi:hypothetical protein